MNSYIVVHDDVVKNTKNKQTLVRIKFVKKKNFEQKIIWIFPTEYVSIELLSRNMLYNRGDIK